MFTENPFCNTSAIKNSTYSGLINNELLHIEKHENVSLEVKQAHQKFRDFILSDSFSCVLGKAAVKKQTYRFGLYENIESHDSISGVSRDLYNFILERSTWESEYTTFIASFKTPMIIDEKHFETLMWDFLERLRIKDSAFHDYDTTVSSNPQDNNFAYSFGGQAFFLVGLHPKSSRITRQFCYPTIIFNPHTQFRNLKDSGKFTKFQSLIRKREEKLQGNINPNLSDFGEASEARQYSGRHVEKNWICPHMLQANKA